MNDYLLLMHDDIPAGAASSDELWGAYFSKLRALGVFEGGSSIGGGACLSKAGHVVPIAKHLTGFLRVRAPDLEAAKQLVMGNPVYEAGGTVEIRELPRD
jgi:YCII-related domain